MTEMRRDYARTRRPRRRRSLRRTTTRVAIVSTVAALIVSGFLSLQMAAGKDPVLAPKRQAVANARPTLKRRVIKRNVIVRKVQGATGVPEPAPSAPAATPPPVVSQPAPVQAAPPAPVVTRAS
jgi:hypothetical protein